MDYLSPSVRGKLYVLCFTLGEIITREIITKDISLDVEFSFGQSESADQALMPNSDYTKSGPRFGALNAVYGCSWFLCPLKY